MAIELVTKFLPIVDELFYQESKKGLLTNQNFTWDGAQTVKVYSVTTADMNDYGRSGPEGSNWSRYGPVQSLDATTQPMTLRMDRSFTFAIDKLDSNETLAQLAAASALGRQVREVVIPEVDKYTYAQMIDGAGATPAAVALTPANIYDEILKANTALDNADAPEVSRTLLVTPDVYAIMKRSPDIVMETNIGNDMRLRGVVAMIDGANVIKVSPGRLPDNFGFMLSHSVATVAPTKLEDFTIHQNPPGINGALVEGRIVYDAFVLNNKKTAIYYQEQA